METKAWYKSKTIWMGMITALVAALVQFQVVLENADGVPSWLLGIVGAAIILLRMVTKQPIGGSDSGG